MYIGPSRVFLNGLAGYLPESRVDVNAAVSAGRYNSQRAARDGFTSVAVERQAYPLDMALSACRSALGPMEGEEVTTLIFASVHRHGHKRLWPAASYLHNRLRMRPGSLAYSLSHGCNGGFIALQIAVTGLLSGADKYVLVAGADKFENTLFDRWNSDLGTVYGDGGCALLLSKLPGPIEVLALENTSGTSLEAMYRDPIPSEEAIGSAAAEHDVGSAKRAYFDQHGRGVFDQVFRLTLNELRVRLLERFPLEAYPAAYVVYPNVGAGISAGLYVEAFGDLARKDAWHFGRSIGHTGVSDQFLGLEHIIKSGLVSKGDRVLLVGAGNGLSAAVMLLEIGSESEC